MFPYHFHKFPINMKPPWSLFHSAWSLGGLLPLLAWIKVTYLHWGSLSFSALAQTIPYTWTSFVVQLVTNMPAMQETPVQFLGWEDPLEKGKTIHSSILAWKIPWTYSPRGHKELDTTEWFSLSLLLSTRIYIYIHIKSSFRFFWKLFKSNLSKHFRHLILIQNMIYSKSGLSNSMLLFKHFI